MKSSGKSASDRGKKKWSGKREPFEHGPFFRGEGYSFLSDEIATREFTHGLISSELSLLVAISRHVWKKKNVIVRLSVSFLMVNSQLKQRTLERQIGPESRLRRQGFLRLHRADRDEGNQYVVEPVLIWSSKWHLLENIEMSLVSQAGRPTFDEDGAIVKSDLFSRHDIGLQKKLPGTAKQKGAPLTPEEEKARHRELLAQLRNVGEAAADPDELPSPSSIV